MSYIKASKSQPVKASFNKMFGKLSLWAANSYHGPAIPKLDIQHNAQHADAGYAAQLDELDTQPADAGYDPYDIAAHFRPFDIDINPRIMAEWSAEQKAEFIVANRAILQSHQYLFMALDGLRLDSVQDIVYQMQSSKNFEHIIHQIYRVKFITAYLQANNGNISENLAIWLHDKHQIFKHGNLERYLLTMPITDIMYIIKYGYHPVKITTDPECIHQILLNLKTKPEVLKLIKPFIYLPLEVDVVNMYCKSIEETHRMLCEDEDAEVPYMALMTYTAVQFCEFVAIYKGGIPSTMHARWIEYAYRLPAHMQNVDNFIMHANRKIKPEDHWALYKYLWTNRALLNEVVKCVECRQDTERYLNSKYSDFNQ